MKSGIFIYVYTHTHTLPHILYSSVDEHLDDFHILSIVDNAAMNIEVHVSFWIMVFSRYIPRSGIVGSYGSSIFSFFF